MSMVFNNEIGDIIISPNAIAKIAGAVATKCYGVVGMASRNKKDGLVSLLKTDNLTKGVKVVSDKEGISIVLHIIVEYGVNINAICESIIHNVEYQIEKSLGTKVNKVTVQVESVRVGH